MPHRQTLWVKIVYSHNKQTYGYQEFGKALSPALLESYKAKDYDRGLDWEIVEHPPRAHLDKLKSDKQKQIEHLQEDIERYNILLQTIED